ncbi:MAG: hypothetical protein CXR30_08520 [Geobacter sp.]|nr:MAG: hypothetical protein CXR30_08520 [Geobacter sp.]
MAITIFLPREVHEGAAWYEITKMEMLPCFLYYLGNQSTGERFCLLKIYKVISHSKPPNIYLIKLALIPFPIIVACSMHYLFRGEMKMAKWHLAQY